MIFSIFSNFKAAGKPVNYRLTGSSWSEDRLVSNGQVPTTREKYFICAPDIYVIAPLFVEQTRSSFICSQMKLESGWITPILVSKMHRLSPYLEHRAITFLTFSKDEHSLTTRLLDKAE